MMFRSVRAMMVLVALAVLALCASAVVVASGDVPTEDLDETPSPPWVMSGSAKWNCERIVAAGYSPHDYVRVLGAWWWWPGWEGPEDARMSRIWAGTPECRVETAEVAGGEAMIAQVKVKPPSSPVVGGATGAPQNGGGSSATKEPDAPAEDPKQEVAKEEPKPEPAKSDEEQTEQPATQNAPVQVSPPQSQPATTYRCRELWTSWSTDWEADPSGNTPKMDDTGAGPYPDHKYNPDKHFLVPPNNKVKGSWYWAGIPQIRCG